MEARAIYTVGEPCPVCWGHVDDVAWQMGVQTMADGQRVITGFVLLPCRHVMLEYRTGAA